MTAGTHSTVLDAHLAEAGRKSIQVWSDFVCPFCFLAEEVLNEAARGLDIEIVWMPFELREYPTPTLRPEDEYLPRVWQQSVYPLAARLGVPVSLPTISPQPYTRLAFIGFQYAQEQGQGSAYVDAVFKAFFQKDRDIGATEVLVGIAEEVGLRGAEFTAALNDGTYAARHDAALTRAKAEGITAVPTLQLGNRRLVGLPDQEALRRVLQQAA